PHQSTMDDRGDPILPLTFAFLSLSFSNLEAHQEKDSTFPAILRSKNLQEQPSSATSSISSWCVLIGSLESREDICCWAMLIPPMKKPVGERTPEFGIEINKPGVGKINCLMEEDIIPCINVICIGIRMSGLKVFQLIGVATEFSLAQNLLNIKGMIEDDRGDIPIEFEVFIGCRRKEMGVRREI
ncbi:hypothetical protein Prudu_016696, partial [Prunus dulcis]